MSDERDLDTYLDSIRADAVVNRTMANLIASLERRRAVHAGEVTWGPWRYDARTELLSLEDGADLFDVDVGQSLPVRTTAEELARAADKGWMDTETLGWLLRAMNELGRLRDHGAQRCAAPDVDLVASTKAHLGASTSAPPDVGALHLARALEHVLTARGSATLARAEVRKRLEARTEVPTELRTAIIALLLEQAINAALRVEGALLDALSAEAPTESGKRKSLTAGARRAGTAR